MFSLIKRLDKHSELEGGHEYFCEQYLTASLITFRYAIVAIILMVAAEIDKVDLALLLLWAIPLIICEILKIALAQKIIKERRFGLIRYFHVLGVFAFLGWLGYQFILGANGAEEVDIIWRGFVIFIVTIFALNAMQYSLVTLLLTIVTVCSGLILYPILFTDLPTQNILRYAVFLLSGSFLILIFGYNSYLLAVEKYAVVVENKRLIEELDQLVSHDTLTGQHSRRYFDEQLARYTNALPRSEKPFCVAIIDIDFFKSVNDTYGHQAGDTVLSRLSNLVKDTIRHTDLLARYGGEEFALLLPDTNLDSAVAVLEKVRHTVERHSFEIDENRINVTVSMGITKAEKGSSQKSLILAADMALYQAKKNGRNQVRVKS